MLATTILATTILAKVDADRLQRGVEGLASGAYNITLTRQNEDEISAYVANGDGKTYSVALTATKAFCGCPDSMFRGKTCKHATALALYVIRTPKVELKQEEPMGEDLLPITLPKLAKVRRTA